MTFLLLGLCASISFGRFALLAGGGLHCLAYKLLVLTSLNCLFGVAITVAWLNNTVMLTDFNVLLIK